MFLALWLMRLFQLKRYGEAWGAVKKAREIKVIIPKNSLKRLEEVFPAPPGNHFFSNNYLIKGVVNSFKPVFFF